MRQLIHHIDIVDRYTGDTVGSVQVKSEAFDVYLRSEDNSTVLSIGEDTYEKRKQLLLFAGEDCDTLLHLRYLEGTLDHIRRGDSREAPILSDNEADPPHWLHIKPGN